MTKFFQGNENVYFQTEVMPQAAERKVKVRTKPRPPPTFWVTASLQSPSHRQSAEARESGNSASGSMAKADKGPQYQENTTDFDIAYNVVGS